MTFRPFFGPYGRGEGQLKRADRNDVSIGQLAPGTEFTVDGQPVDAPEILDIVASQALTIVAWRRLTSALCRERLYYSRRVRAAIRPPTGGEIRASLPPSRLP